MVSKSRPLWLLLSGAALSMAAAQPAPTALPPVRMQDTPDFQYVRSYFPFDADAGDIRSVDVMSQQDRDRARRQLQERLDELVEAFANSRHSVRDALREAIGAPAEQLRLPQNARIEVVNAVTAEAAATSGGIIRISGRTIRGFLVGSLREWITGDSGEAWMVSGLIGWPRENGASFSTTEAEERFRLLIRIIEAGGPMTATEDEQRQALSHFAEHLDRENPPADPLAFRREVDDILSGRQHLSAAENWRMGGAFGLFTSQIAQPAERFMLAHELGHLALGHVAEASPSCARLSEMERHADAFAVSLLAYFSYAGDITSFMYLGASEFQTPDEFLDGAPDDPFVLHQGSFGFRHAFLYGMAQAGMIGGRGDCPVAPGERRLADASVIWRKVMARRLRAVGTLGDFQRQRPAFVAMRQTRVPLTEQEGVQLLEDSRSRCRGAPARLVNFPSPLLDGNQVYSVNCSWPISALTAIPTATAITAGQAFFSNWAATYRTDRLPEAFPGVPQ